MFKRDFQPDLMILAFGVVWHRRISMKRRELAGETVVDVHSALPILFPNGIIKLGAVHLSGSGPLNV